MIRVHEIIIRNIIRVLDYEAIYFHNCTCIYIIKATLALFELHADVMHVSYLAHFTLMYCNYEG